MREFKSEEEKQGYINFLESTLERLSTGVHMNRVGIIYSICITSNLVHNAVFCYHFLKNELDNFEKKGGTRYYYDGVPIRGNSPVAGFLWHPLDLKSREDFIKNLISEIKEI